MLNLKARTPRSEGQMHLPCIESHEALKRLVHLVTLMYRLALSSPASDKDNLLHFNYCAVKLDDRLALHLLANAASALLSAFKSHYNRIINTVNNTKIFIHLK